MGKTKTLLQEGGLSKDWLDPKLCCGLSKKAWKDTVYDSVEERETSDTMSRLATMNSNHAARFVRSKFWGKVGKTSPASLARSVVGELLCQSPTWTIEMSRLGGGSN